MRYLVITLALAFSVVEATAQMSLDYNNGNSQFQKVIDVPGKSAADLYKIAQRWVANTYKNPDAATYSQLENELIKGDGFQRSAVKLAAIVSGDAIYSWRVDVKDDKIRLTISNMAVGHSSGRNAFEAYLFKKDGEERTNTQAQNVKTAFTDISNALLKSLEDMISNPKKDDW